MLVLALTLAAFTFTSTSAAQAQTTTTAPPSTSIPPNCETPGPSSVTESALCDLSAQTDSMRAEVLLGLCLLLVLVAALLAVTVWK